MSSVATSSRQPRSTFSDRVDESRVDESEESNFSASVARLLDRIDCRSAESSEDREAIFRLRHQAYVRDGSISPNPSGRFSDPYDDKGRVFLFGLYLDGQLASSVRLHIASQDYPDFPSLEVFRDILQPELDAGKILVDPTRFVTDENLARLHRGLPYVTTRLCGMAARYFKADYLLAAVRVEHQAFYRRIFNHRLICEARAYPLLAKPISLMTIHYPTVSEQVHRRYRFFQSTFFERRMLFERPTRPPSK
jgi:N-acyl amino acid synthase FeeM